MTYAALLVVSILMQVSAAIVLLALIPVTGRKKAWILIAAALALMAIRSLMLLHNRGGDYPVTADMIQSEVLGTVVSALLLGGALAHLGFLGRMRRMESEAREASDIAVPLFEQTPLPIARLDGSLVIVSLNSAFARISGRACDECTGRDFAAVFADGDIRSAAADTLRDGVTREGREAVLSAVGAATPETRFWDWSVSPVRSPDARVTGVIVSAVEVTARVEAEQRLRQSIASLRTLFDMTGAGIARCDTQGTILEASEALHSILGYPMGELAGINIRTITHPDDLPRNDLALSMLLEAKGGLGRSEARYRRKDGSHVWTDLTMSVVRDADNLDTQVMAVAMDITMRKRFEEQLRHDALHDPLTGLPNRALFVDRLQLAIARSQRTPARMFDVLFLDLDDFKKVNDSLGHAAGDQLLVELAGRVTGCLRPGDTVARIGGDDFAVLLDDSQHRLGSLEVAQRMLASVREPFGLSGRRVVVTGSIGIAPSDPGRADSLEYLRDADAAMYQAKSLGKNRFRVFDEPLHDQAVRRIALEDELRRAIERREFVLHYQPVVDLGTSNVSGLEALVRWAHPDRGLVRPDQFVPVAEDSGLIVPLGEWVVHEACRMGGLWRQRRPDLRINVNLSPRQFADPHLGEVLKSALAHADLPPEALTLELTEGAMLEDIPATMELLADLKALGVRVVMDDFGKGYSSLGYLSRFSLDGLKVDALFVRDIQTDRGSVGIVRAVLALASTFDLEVVAEGVESEEQAETLRGMGCGYGQGYLWGRPVPSETVEQLLPASGRSAWNWGDENS